VPKTPHLPPRQRPNVKVPTKFRLNIFFLFLCSKPIDGKLLF
jgi:hypothetical protein